MRRWIALGVGIAAVVAIVGGLVSMAATGWQARELWSSSPALQPICLGVLRCTPETLEAQRQQAWSDLLPGEVAVALGVLLTVAAAWLAPVGSRRMREGRPVMWSVLALIGGVLAVVVGLVTTFVAFASRFVSPPLATGAVTGGVVVLVVVATFVGRVRSPGRHAVTAAVVAVALGLAVAVPLLESAAPTGVRVVLMLLVPPAVIGVATVLGVRALARVDPVRVAGRF